MSHLIKKLPIPASGLMLGLAVLGNLVRSHGEIYRNILGLVAAAILVMLAIKVVKNPACIKEGLGNPVVGGVMATYPMGMMILSTYLVPFARGLALGLWVIGILLHVALLIAFSARYLRTFNIRKVFTTYYIVYVGIVAGSVSAPAHNMFQVGEALFWFGFAAYLILLPIVLYRIFVVKEIPAPALPTLIVQAAPGSLCLAGYLSAFQVKSPVMVGILLALAAVSILIAFAFLPKLIVGKFIPAFSSFTFPIVVSGVALKMASTFYLNTGNSLPWLAPAALLLEVLSIVIVLYVLMHYTLFLAAPEVVAPQSAKA